jgi:hypothetical protein
VFAHLARAYVSEQTFGLRSARLYGTNCEMTERTSVSMIVSSRAWSSRFSVGYTYCVTVAVVVRGILLVYVVPGVPVVAVWKVYVSAASKLSLMTYFHHVRFAIAPG